MNRKALLIIILVVIIPLVIYQLGPTPNYEELDPKITALNIELEKLDQWVADKESKVQGLKPDNEARIIWSDSIRKTEWSMVYLHGFSASQREGFPVHKAIADWFGMNLYLSRIAGHGIEGKESFADLTPADMINSAKEAIAIGHLLGEKVLVMSCSTGGTYSIYLAAMDPEWIDAMVLYSPNIRIYDPNAKLLGGPWGLELGKMIAGEYQSYEENIGNIKEQYTTSEYRTEGLVALQHLLQSTMTDEVFSMVTQPTFMGYYYKSEEEQDKVVSVQGMLEFASRSSIPKTDFRQLPFPESGNHVICSDLHSSDYQSVIEETKKFVEEVLKIEPEITPTPAL